MAADSPLALNLRDCYFRPSTRRTPRSRGIITGCRRVPRESRMIDGNSSGGVVNPFAYSPPNPFLSRLAGGASGSEGGAHHRNEAVQSQQDGVSSNSSSSSLSSSSSVLPSLIHPPPLQAPLLNRNFSFSTPSSPRHGSSLSLSEDPHGLLSPFNADRQEDEDSSSSSYLSVLSPVGSGGVGPSSKRRRSIQIDGGIQAPPLGCSDDGSFSSFSSSREGYLSSSSACSSSSSLSSTFPFSGRHENGGIIEGGKDLPSSSIMDLTDLPAISVTKPPKSEGGGDMMKVEEEGEEMTKKKNEASTNGTEKSEKPTVFIDSGCYSLCYHTAMTAPPPTLSMAPLSTHFANEDREARRRRKACISVLRSVQSSLQSTPETSPHLGPSADPSTTSFSSSTTSPFLSSSVLPPPPPAVRQPFFPSAFGDTSSSSSSLSGYRSSTDNPHTSGEKTVSGDRGGRTLGQHQRDVLSACGGGVCTPEKKEAGSETQQPSLAPLAQLRLRPDFFSPCTLGTLIGACVHAYDEIRSAYPPPQPPPRLCILSLPALYGQLPPHLASTAVLLDTDAPFVGEPSKCLPIECSQCVFKSSSSSSSFSSGSSIGASSSTPPSQASPTQGGLHKHDVLPVHLHGEFDIIVCETRTVTVGAVENTAACIRALSRDRSVSSVMQRPHHQNQAPSLYPGGASVQPDGLYSSIEGQQQSGSYCTSIEAATEALNSLSLHGRGEGRLGGYTPGPSVYTEKRALPPSTRVIMLSTCLLSPLVDDLLGLKQCPFQPYIPSSALSSLQLQCIYTNFTSFPRLQKHNDVDFSTRVRIRSKSKSGGNQVLDGSNRPCLFGKERDDNNSHDRNRTYLETTAGYKNPDAAGPSSPIVGSDEMVARAMVIHTQEEERAAMRGQESGAEGAIGKGENESCLTSEEDEETIQQESILLKAFDGLQLHVGTGFATGKSGGGQGSHSSPLSQGGNLKMRPVAVGTCRGPTSLPSGIRTPDPRATMTGNGGVGTIGALSSALLQEDSQRHRGGGRCDDKGLITAAGRSQACKGITMRTGADADEDDGIDYELECGSHFGMASHDL
ncbi:hypothetical protein CSUI_004694 [Cystoisospora suis]|uniref:Uncharacterized protein n=1 Tax=Cystoisospora suis TaxID=483139 RepID=A0A2C6KAF7_9APIC|nr:hypothetical protein CSUI_004694 [Cystoisospora suis]